MSWIKGNRYLSESEMQNNALIIGAYLDSKGWTLNAIAGMLGNMQTESTINPGIWQSLNSTNTSGGFGLVQWTPSTNYTNWASSNGYAIDDGNGQLKWIDEVTASVGQWIKTDDYYFSFSEFKTSTESPEYLASAFLKNFERAGVEKETERRTQARTWYTYLTENLNVNTFTPRLDSSGMEGSIYWYSGNPFYQSGYGLPNCTCYAWGRFWEISDTSGDGSNKPTLPTGDAGVWWERVTGYETGQTPKLGAVICWSDNTGGAGHVGIVEKIAENGDITVSQSAWGGTYFWTNTKSAADGYSYGKFTFQGFIYNPFVTGSGGGGGNSGSENIYPILSPKKRKGFKFVLFNQRRRTQWINRNF